MERCEIMADDKKLTVVQINALGSTFSTGRTTREMHDYFNEHGIKSYLATARNSDCNDAYQISNMNAMHFDTFLTICTGLEAYHSKRQTRKLLRYLDEVKPDIVHLRVLHNSYINLGLLLNYLAKNDIATVLTLHDFWFMTGKCCFYNHIPCSLWETGCHDCPSLKEDARKKWFDRTSKMWADKKKWFSAIPRLAVVGNSNWTTNEAKRSFLKDAKIVENIYNWIDFSIFYPRESQKLKEKLDLTDKKVILGVSAFWSINDRKGFDAYLSLAKILPDEYRIVLVGSIKYDGELPGNIISLPKTNSTDKLAEYYSMADVYLNLAVGETFGKVSAEAISCGTPVVALNATANPEIVPQGAGEVINNVEPDTILNAVQRVLTGDRASYEKLCLKHAKENFDKETNIKKYINLYYRLLYEES